VKLAELREDDATKLVQNDGPNLVTIRAGANLVSGD
jgi:hypothetical protein